MVFRPSLVVLRGYLGATARWRRGWHTKSSFLLCVAAEWAITPGCGTLPRTQAAIREGSRGPTVAGARGGLSLRPTPGLPSAPKSGGRLTEAHHDSEISNKSFTFPCSAKRPPPGWGVCALSFPRPSPYLRRRPPRPGFFSPRRLRTGVGGAAGAGAAGAGPGAGRTPLPCAGL